MIQFIDCFPKPDRPAHCGTFVCTCALDCSLSASCVCRLLLLFLSFLSRLVPFRDERVIVREAQTTHFVRSSYCSLCCFRITTFSCIIAVVMDIYIIGMTTSSIPSSTYLRMFFMKRSTTRVCCCQRRKKETRVNIVSENGIQAAVAMVQIFKKR